MTPVSRPIIALGILNVDAGRYSFDARAKLLVAQDLLLLLQSTKTPLTASAENSLFQDVFSVIELANAVLERHAVITYAANVFMAPSWWLTLIRPRKRGNHLHQIWWDLRRQVANCLIRLATRDGARLLSVKEVLHVYFGFHVGCGRSACRTSGPFQYRPGALALQLCNTKA